MPMILKMFLIVPFQRSYISCISRITPSNYKMGKWSVYR
jgi:hypothetical protein